MRLQVQSRPKSPHKAVLLVEGKRVDGKVHQHLVRHIGVAKHDDELESLKRIGEFVLAQIGEESQPHLYPPEEMANQVIAAQQRSQRENERKTVGSHSRKARECDDVFANPAEVEEVQRVITGIPEVCGLVFREIGLHRVLHKSRFRASSEALFRVVLARIANPDNKSPSVIDLEESLGISLSLSKVYQMMDQLSSGRIDRIRKMVGDATHAQQPQRAREMVFYCTKVDFEAATADGLHQHGCGEERKPAVSQALLALAVSEEGLPLSYEALLDSTSEGRSLVHVLQEMKKRQRQRAERTVCVADLGMLDETSLATLDKHGDGYVAGAELYGLPANMEERVLDLKSYRPMEGAHGCQMAEFEHRGRRLVVTRCSDRAQEDRHDRMQAVEQLRRILESSERHEYKMPIRPLDIFLVGGEDARLMDDEVVFAEDERWDGLEGVVTNLRDMPAEEVVSRFQGLRQVEASFRITRHDLRVRPVFHWTEELVSAHMAIAYMADACVRHLAFRVAQRQRRMSPETIRSTLVDRQASILRCRSSGRRSCISSKPSRETESIYAAMGIGLETGACHID